MPQQKVILSVFSIDLVSNIECLYDEYLVSVRS